MRGERGRLARVKGGRNHAPCTWASRALISAHRCWTSLGKVSRPGGRQLRKRASCDRDALLMNSEVTFASCSVASIVEDMSEARL